MSTIKKQVRNGESVLKLPSPAPRCLLVTVVYLTGRVSSVYLCENAHTAFKNAQRGAHHSCGPASCFYFYLINGEQACSCLHSSLPATTSLPWANPKALLSSCARTHKASNNVGILQEWVPKSGIYGSQGECILNVLPAARPLPLGTTPVPSTRHRKPLTLASGASPTFSVPPDGFWSEAKHVFSYLPAISSPVNSPFLYSDPFFCWAVCVLLIGTWNLIIRYDSNLLYMF